MKRAIARDERTVPGAARRDTDSFSFTLASHATALPLHAHEHPTITVVLGGSFNETYEGSRGALECAVGSALFRPAGAMHRDAIGREGARCLMVEIGVPVSGVLGSASTLFALPTRRVHPALHAMARRIERELACWDAASTLAVEGLTMELAAIALRAVSPGGRVASDGLRRARDLLHDRRCDRGLRISEIAATAGLHPVHFARAFRRHFGSAPGAYLRRLRLAWAADAIVAAQDDRQRRVAPSLATIAHDAGFADQSHFSRAFKSAFGYTPGEWRRLHQVRRDP